MYSKTELTEIRKQIFPRYFLQNVAIVSDTKNNLRLEKVSCGNLAIIEHLQLKPLSSITDEEKAELGKVFWSNVAAFDNMGDEFYTKEVSIMLEYSLGFRQDVYQYLQLKGYALSQLVILNGKPVTLSVEQQIESLIIETKN